MAEVTITGVLEFNKDIVGLRVLEEEPQRFYDIDQEVFSEQAQSQVKHLSQPRISLVQVGDKLVSQEEHSLGKTIPVIETRNDIVKEVEKVLLSASNPQPLLRNETTSEPKRLVEYMVTVESQEYDPIEKAYKPLQLTGSFHAPTREDARKQGVFYYAQELDTTKDAITVLYVETVQEHEEHKERKAKAKAEGNPTPEPKATREANPKSEALDKAKAEVASTTKDKPKAKDNPKEKVKAEPKKKTKQYTVLISIKSLTADGQGVEDREIKRDFEDVNLVNVKVKAREALAEEYNVPLKDVKVLKAGVKK